MTFHRPGMKSFWNYVNIETCGNGVSYFQTMKLLEMPNRNPKSVSVNIIYLLQVLKLLVSRGLLLGEEAAVPGGPLFVPVPAHQHQVIQVIPRTQGTLAAPHVLYQVAQVTLLCKHNCIITVQLVMV